jgi:hypothetical protein
MMGNGVQINTLNMPINYTQVTKVPMIYIRLPHTNLPISQNTLTSRSSIATYINMIGGLISAAHVGVAPPMRITGPDQPQSEQIANMQDIQTSLNTIQPIMTNGRFEYRSTTVVGTDGILIISIPRRTYQPLMTNVHNLPQVFNMSKLPHNAIGLETLNNANINTNLVLSIGNTMTETEEAAYANNYTNKLFLKSAVVLNEKEADDSNNNKFIYGSKTYVFNYDNAGGNIRVYDPIKESNNANILPIRKVNYDPNRQRGTTIYCKHDNQVQLSNIYIKDKIKDFRTNQTILIYTNELKNIPNNALSKVNATSMQNSHIKSYNYYYGSASALVFPDYSTADYIKTNYAYYFMDYLRHNTIIGYMCVDKETVIGANIAQRNLVGHRTPLSPLFIPISY